MHPTRQNCGCGEPPNYIVTGPDGPVGSCNKYAKCPTYQELKEINKKNVDKLIRAKVEIQALLNCIDNKITINRVKQFIETLP